MSADGRMRPEERITVFCYKCSRPTSSGTHEACKDADGKIPVQIDYPVSWEGQ